jgi:hypothetical protein
VAPIAVIVAIAAGAVFLATRGDDDNDTVTAGASTTAAASATSVQTVQLSSTPADKALAQRSVLQAQDLPTGWVTEPDDPDDELISDEDYEKCSGLRVTDNPTAASAESPSFSQNDTRFASSAAAVALSEADAKRIYQQLVGEQFSACLKDLVAEGARKSYAEDYGSRLRMGQSNVGRSAITTPADETGGFRIQVDLSVDGQQITLTFDFGVVRKGRVVGQFFFFDFPDRSDQPREGSDDKARGAHDVLSRTAASGRKTMANSSFCPRCGSPVQLGASFCASCGTAVGTPARADQSALILPPEVPRPGHPRLLRGRGHPRVLHRRATAGPHLEATPDQRAANTTEQAFPRWLPSR